MGISPYGNRTILVDVVLGDGSETASGAVEVFSLHPYCVQLLEFWGWVYWLEPPE